MRWDLTLNKKWIVAERAHALGDSFTIVNQCVLVAKRSGVLVEGFSVFDPKDITAAFMKRVQERGQSAELKGSTFELIGPQYLAPHVDKLVKDCKVSNITYVTSPFVHVSQTNGKFALRTKLRVLNVDDSPVLLKLLNHVFSSQGWVENVGQITNPMDAVEKILALNPDVVTLDIQMPGKNGLQVLKELLAVRYFPVLMISSLSMEDGSLVFNALNAGAFDYIQKPTAEERASFTDDILSKSLSAVEAGVAPVALPKESSRPALRSLSLITSYPPNLVWAIGSSTGGTQAITRAFSMLPRMIPPTLIVQHIPPIFSRAFAESLAAVCPFKVKEAAHGDALEANCVYIAPGGKQMTLERAASGRYAIAINDDEPVNRFKPSVDYLFNRLATKTDLQFVAGVLTGMGRDGSAGLLALRNAGARTFAQDESSSVVYGMPKAAFENGGAEQVCHIDDVAQQLLKFSANSKA
ncbi:MAG: chemotaxis-specific protein-glutamate methyltransferase CheB [Proteobacteria bacterium]|nr:chemotaxis-specific protein-glutamate methyltransferase CheB [Pseudomonadota bacterium]